MKNCKLCGKKKGFLTSFSSRGLCLNCEHIVNLSVDSHFRVINESSSIIQSTKNIDTKISRYHTLINTLQSLYDEVASKGIQVTDYDIPQMINDLEIECFNNIELEATKLIKNYLDKANLAKTLNAKINNANKALLLLNDYQQKYGYENKGMSQNIMAYIHKAELDDIILKAEKLEFKGNNKKAIDQYKEALFFIHKDEIDDVFQKEIINKINQKIETLTT